MKMLKKIIKNKTFLISLLSFCFSLLCFVTVGYAWIVMSNTASVNDFIGIVGEKTLDFQFSQVVDDDLIHSDDVKAENSIPGESNTFVLTVENKGKEDTRVNVSFSKIFSEINYGEGKDYTKNYKERYQKIQYAYSYCINLIVYVNPGLKIENIFGSDLVEIPDRDYIIDHMWIPIEMHEDFNYFNSVDLKGNDISNYSIIHNLQVNSAKPGSTNPFDYSTVLIYFTIKFNSKPRFPGSIEGQPDGTATNVIPNVPENISFDGEYYVNQRFNISNILIEGLD